MKFEVKTVKGFYSGDYKLLSTKYKGQLVHLRMSDVNYTRLEQAGVLDDFFDEFKIKEGE